MSRLNISGLSDTLVDQLVDQLGLFEQPSTVDDTKLSESSHKRTMLQNFVQTHHEAERAVCKLVLKHLGISTSSVRRLSRATHILSATGTNNKDPLPCEMMSTSPPQFSPVPWLPEHSWKAMTKKEKMEFMSYIYVSSCSHPRRLFYDPHNFIMFGGSLDRVVLGHGPRHLLVLVGVHGNEPCGVEAAKLILQRQQVFLGDANTTEADLRACEDRWVSLDDLLDTITVEFAVGNPKALECSQRYIHKNLNRMFDIHTLVDDPSAILHGYEYELQRARVLAESIRHSDVVLDVHSCSSDSLPFALPSSMDVSEELAACLPVKYVVESLVHRCLGGGTTLDCALLHGVPGVCVECGYHKHPDIVARATAVISRFLLLQGSPCSSNNDFDGTKPTVIRCEDVEIVREGFEWVDNFSEFELTPQDMPVFRDAEKGVTCCNVEGGAYLVMPTKIPVIGEEALFWAKEVVTE